MGEDWTAKLLIYVLIALFTGEALGLLVGFIIMGWFDDIQLKLEKIKKNRKRCNTYDSVKGDHTK